MSKWLERAFQRDSNLERIRAEIEADRTVLSAEIERYKSLPVSSIVGELREILAYNAPIGNIAPALRLLTEALAKLDERTR